MNGIIQMYMNVPPHKIVTNCHDIELLTQAFPSLPQINNY